MKDERTRGRRFPAAISMNLPNSLNYANAEPQPPVRKVLMSGSNTGAEAFSLSGSFGHSVASGRRFGSFNPLRARVSHFLNSSGPNRPQRPQHSRSPAATITHAAQAAHPLSGRHVSCDEPRRPAPGHIPGPQRPGAVSTHPGPSLSKSGVASARPLPDAQSLSPCHRGRS